MTPSSKKGHVAWSVGDGGDVVAPRSTPNENDEVPQRARSIIPGRGILYYPYRVYRLPSQYEPALYAV